MVRPHLPMARPHFVVAVALLVASGALTDAASIAGSHTAASTLHGRGRIRGSLNLLQREALRGSGMRQPAGWEAMAAAAGPTTMAPGVPTLEPPKLSVADLTPPTMVPPLPAQLISWKDAQPLDTAIGHFFVEGFGGQPTLTPPPVTPALNIAYGCPVLLDWPTEVVVTLPDYTCGHKGSWGTTSDPPTTIMNWSTACNPFTWDLAAPVTYSTANGDKFGTSQTKTTFVGTNVRLRDCLDNVRYTVDEKVYRREGTPDPEACNKYGSCDGTISLQYFLHDGNDRIIGQTAFLGLFQDVFTVVASNGAVIATISRNPGWNPISEVDCDTPRQWTIQYGSGAAAAFPDASERWPIAELVTIISVRDGYRRSSGLMRPSACEVVRGIFTFSFVTLALAMLAAVALFFYHVLMNRIRAKLVTLEAVLCPKRMKRPAKYEN